MDFETFKAFCHRPALTNVILVCLLKILLNLVIISR